MPNDPLDRYHFRDDHGHPLENCVEYQELLAENELLRGEVTRLNKEADWLAESLDIITRLCAPEVINDLKYKSWREAARKAVEEKERYG